MTDAFKQNSASLSTEIRAIKGDIAQEFTQHLESLTTNIALKLSGKIDLQ